MKRYLNHSLLLLVLNITFNVSANPLLSAPSPITADAIANAPLTWDGTWGNDHNQFYFVYDHGKGALALEYFDTLPPAFTDQEANKFTQIDTQSGTIFRFRFGTLESPNFFSLGSIMHHDDSYFLAKPRHSSHKDNQNLPQEISTADLAKRIKTSKVVYYTGAGISVAGGVPDTNTILLSLGLQADQHVSENIDFAKKILSDPQAILNAFVQSCDAAFGNPTTQAHGQLTELALLTHSPIFTENFDLLHERTGYAPYHCSAESMRADINPHDFAQVDMIICIGLHNDNRGFLSWYKLNNPNGIIVACNIATPDYVDSKDYMITQDLTITINQLLTCMQPA